MSYEIVFYQPGDDSDDPEAGEHFFLGNIGGWSSFVEWVASLPASHYPALLQFCRDGCITGTDALSMHLRRALRSRPPASAGVRVIGKELLERLGVGAPEETAAVEM